MKKILTALLCSWCGLTSAQTAEEWLNDGKNTENVLTFGLGYGIPGYSPLRQINKGNVRRLVPLWSTNTMSDTGELAHPAIYQGVMYIVNGHQTLALDVATGRQIWRTPVEYDRAVLRISNAGAIMRGIPVRVTVGDRVYWYFPSPFPLSRCRADQASLLDVTQYEAYTCLKPGARYDANDPQIDKKVGLLWLGNEFAQMSKDYCNWSTSRPDEKCDDEAVNRSAFVSWVDCRL